MDMKKVPFNLQLELSGQATYIDGVDTELEFIAQCDAKLWMKFNNGKTAIFAVDSAYHLIPEEPVKERWAVVEQKLIFDDFGRASSFINLNNQWDRLTIVKLAE